MIINFLCNEFSHVEMKIALSEIMFSIIFSLPGFLVSLVGYLYQVGFLSSLPTDLLVIYNSYSNKELVTFKRSS